MTSITIDVEDYLDDDDVREMARDRGILREAGQGAGPGEFPETDTNLWRRLATDIRDTARAGDWQHLEILLLRMLRYADIDQPGDTLHASRRVTPTRPHA